MSKFKINPDKLTEQTITTVMTYRRMAERHLKYYYESMKAFKNPHLRLKTQDTVYYEQILPITNNIIKEYERKSAGAGKGS